jgi:hypothetical protein
VVVEGSAFVVGLVFTLLRRRSIATLSTEISLFKLLLNVLDFFDGTFCGRLGRCGAHTTLKPKSCATVGGYTPEKYIVADLSHLCLWASRNRCSASAPNGSLRYYISLLLERRGRRIGILRRSSFIDNKVIAKEKMS